MEKTVQVSVELGGKLRTLRFDFNAYAALEEKYDTHFLELFNRISGAVVTGKIPRAADISLMIWAAINATDESVTLREVRSWISLQNMDTVIASITSGPFATGRAENDLAPFLPTPPEVVTAAIKALDLQPGDTFIDLGAGDGRLIEAAIAEQPSLAEAIGVEMNPERYAKLVERFQYADEPAVTILNQDINAIDPAVLGRANKVFCYLLKDSNERIRPMLEQSLPAGARVVSHHFRFDTWPIADTQTLEVPGSSMSPHPVHTYIRP